MHHLHLPQCPSTQIFLREHLADLAAKDIHLLVSTDQQTGGIGRMGNSWQHYSDALAFSFTLKPLNNQAMTPIVIGLQLVSYFQSVYDLSLLVKWPNDLLTNEYKKAIGILCHQARGLFLVGIGINWGNSGRILEDSSFKFPAGVLFPQKTLRPNDKKTLPLENKF